MVRIWDLLKEKGKWSNARLYGLLNRQRENGFKVREKQRVIIDNTMRGVFNHISEL